MSEFARSRIAALASESALAVDLAELASLAVRVDAGLLRRLRLELLPVADPGVESDLWFSPLVESRSGSGFQMAPEVVRELRDRLARDLARVAQVRRITAAAHIRCAPAILLEEELNGLALEHGDAAQPEIEARVRPLLCTLAGGGRNALDVARWIVQAATRLDPRVQRAPAVQMLLLASAWYVGSHVASEVPHNATPLGELAWVLSSLDSRARRRIAAVFVPGGLRFEEAPLSDDAIEMPDTDPALVELEWALDTKTSRRTTAVRSGEVVELAGDPDSVMLTTLAGRRYRLGRGSTTAIHDVYDVFLSYAPSDGAVAEELNRWLRSQGLRTFFDRRELRPGLRWIPALEDAIERSKAVAILVGRHGFGNTQQYERELALVRQTRDDAFPVIPVLMPGCKNPPTGFLQLLTWVDLSQGDSVLQQTESLETLRGAIHGGAVSRASIRSLVCPYRGLEPFREEDAAFFCGRDDAIRALFAQVQRYSFVAVVGPSSSGKTSLVFAGLLPMLRQQRQIIMWDVVSLRPGASPLRALAEAFGAAPPDHFGAATIDSYLEREAATYRSGDRETLLRTVNRRLNAAPEKPDRLLIYVDQWEELYAMAPRAEDKDRRQKNAEDVEKFIALLVAAATTERSRVSVVLTVRSNYYQSLIRDPLLSALLPRQQVNIPPMSESDLRSAIETPAKKAGLSFAPPELIEQILSDVGTGEGRLPLLQFALKETWERRTGDRLTAEAYTTVGGVAGAIEKTAQSAYNRLTPAQQEAARRLFLRLVIPGEGQEYTRARSPIPDDPQQREIIDLFSDPKTRLLVTDHAAPQADEAGGGTVEVAHEALIRRWSTLRTWVDATRENLRARTAILRDMAEWEEHKRSESYLLDPGVRLERARALIEDPGDVPVDDIREYVYRSIKRAPPNTGKR